MLETPKKIGYESCRFARQFIMDSIFPQTNIENYLVTRHDVLWSTLKDNPQLVQEYRHGWLDSLIQDFSKPV